MTTLTIEMPPLLVPLFAAPRGSLRYRVMRGGRGSGKSYTSAMMAAIWGAIEPLRILCTREYQNTIKESFHAELKRAIASNDWLTSEYDVGIDYLRHKTNGTEFIFKGLRHNVVGVKSMAQIDLLIVEEAETVPPHSWIDLEPTIRDDESEIWIIYNPKRRDSWVAETFDGENLPPRSQIVDINHDGNPFFPKVLEEQRRYARENMDPAMYRHIWEGAYYEKSEAQIFAGCYRVQDFEPGPGWNGPYYGLDWGFGVSATAGTKSWINENTLYIEYDFKMVGLELDQTSEMVLTRLPDAGRHEIRADNARPESISYTKRKGLPRIVACTKGPGSVEDGIQLIRSFDKVIVHSRCDAILREFELYSYKTDRMSGTILPEPIKTNDDCLDSLRYALEGIKKTRSVLTTKRLFK